MRGFASEASHTCTSSIHVHPQWIAYDGSLTAVSCATESRTGQPLPCRHGTIAQMMAFLTCVRENHMGLMSGCIGSSFLRERRKAQ